MQRVFARLLGSIADRNKVSAASTPRTEVQTTTMVGRALSFRIFVPP
jgi:hypothetical protein